MLVKLDNVSKTYETKTGVTYRALCNVSLDLPEKGLVFLVGASGSGKSTLLNIIGGLDNADNGSIFVAGNALKGMTQVEMDKYRNSLIGFIFQEFNLIETLNVFRNVRLSLDMQKSGESAVALSKEEAAEKVTTVLKNMELFDKANVKVNTLSGGQRQRVAIARALVKNPEILLADEPTGALDSATGLAVMNIFKNISKDKLVIIVSHDLKLAEEYGDRIIEMKDGAVYRDIIRAELAEHDEDRNVKFVSNTLIRFGKNEIATPEDLDKINKLLGERGRKTFVLAETDERKVKAMFPALREAVTADEKSSAVDEPMSSAEKSSAVNEPMSSAEKSGEAIFSSSAVKTQRFKQYYKKESEMKKVELKKSNLPLSGAVKLSLNNINHKKVRLVFTILVTLMSMILFGLANALLRFNVDVAIASTLKQSKIERVSLYAADSGYNTLIRDGVYQKMTSAYPEGYFAKVYGLVDYSKENQSAHGFTGFCGTVEIDDVTKLGYDMIAGSSKPTDGIIISDYVARAIIKVGIFNDVKSINDLIGKTLSCVNVSSVIEGVFKAEPPEYVDESMRTESLMSGFPELYSRYVSSEFITTVKKSTTDLPLKISFIFEKETKDVDAICFDASVIDMSLVAPVGKGKIENDNDVIVTRAFFNTISADEMAKAKVVMTGERPVFVCAGLNVVGVIDDGSYANVLITSRKIIDSAVSERIYPNMLYAKINGNEKKFVSACGQSTLGINERYVIDYRNFEQMFKILQNMIVLLSCIFFLLSVLLLFSFISNSIKMTKKQIGILRSLGARRSDTFKIYALEGLLIGVFSIVLAFIGLTIFAPLINTAFSVGAPYKLCLINLDIFTFGIMFLIGILVSTLGVLLPVRKFVKITPIGAITNKE